MLRATPSAAGHLWLRGIAIWGLWCRLFDFLGGILAPREHLARPFWHLGSNLGAILAPRTTLEDHGSSRMDTELQITGFLPILEWFRDLFLSVFMIQNVFFFSIVSRPFFIDFWFDFSTFGISKNDFSWSSFLTNSGMFFCSLLEALRTVFPILSLENKF